MEETLSVARQCASRPDVAPYAKIVGAWVWCEFPGKPSEETRQWLKAMGFRWNKERGAWQNPCGVFRRKLRHGDPRYIYGERPLVSDENNEARGLSVL
jgi:hypothetical protein